MSQTNEVPGCITLPVSWSKPQREQRQLLSTKRYSSNPTFTEVRLRLHLRGQQFWAVLDPRLWPSSSQAPRHKNLKWSASRLPRSFCTRHVFGEWLVPLITSCVGSCESCVGYLGSQTPLLLSRASASRSPQFAPWALTRAIGEWLGQGFVESA